ncbi:NF-kappa-B inhibitor cactus-like [Amphibalanus amphitrite]|uniref:NF-kappa-B inhibitor cactus-like n=1 Tax=Amphibalanus amphitrite TaxID=1232801 RepID=UPI001C91A51E|nr:NF-kappa-B inhibitor cactus-like [Amphibalanus amphitrite]
MSRRVSVNGRGAVHAVADCAPPPSRGTAFFSARSRHLPVKTCESPASLDQILDSGFISGHLSPTTPPPAGYRYPKEATARPSDAGEEASRLSEELSGLQLEEGRLDAADRALWEERYITALEEAFRGDEDGDTHLHLAIIYGYERVADCLVRLVPHPDFLNLRNSYMQTPLHLAALTGQAALCRHLLVAGADASLRDRHGNTPLHVACARGDLLAAQALTSTVSNDETREAALRYTLPPSLALPPLDEWNYQGLSCLHLAVLTGDRRLVAHLVSHGANVACMEGKSGRTPLHLAVEAGNIVMLEFLATMCKADVRATTYGGLSGYQLALLNARLDVAEVLESLGAAPDALPESDMELSDSEPEMLLKADLSDVRIGGLPLVAAQ